MTKRSAVIALTAALQAVCLLYAGSAQALCPCAANVICVDAAAPGGGSGTCGDPISTIGKGIAAASPGFTVHAVGGTYIESGLVVTNDLTIEGDPDMSTILTDPAPAPPVAGQASFMIESINSNTTIKFLSIVNVPTLTAFGSDNSSTAPNVQMTMDNVDAINVRRGAFLNDVGSRRGNLLVTNSRIKNCETGVQENDGDTVKVQNVEIRDCEVGVERHNSNNFEVSNSRFVCNDVDLATTTGTGTPPTQGPGNVFKPCANVPALGSQATWLLAAGLLLAGALRITTLRRGASPVR